MMRRVLISLGLAKAPMPIRLYAAVGGGIGLVPLVAYFAYRNRERIGEVLGRAKSTVEQTVSHTRKNAVSNGKSPPARRDDYVTTGL